VVVLLVATLAVAVGAVAITWQSNPEGGTDALVTFGVLASLEVSVLVWLAGVAGHLGRLALGGGALAVAVVALVRLQRVEPDWWHRLRAAGRHAASTGPRSLLVASKRHPWSAALALLAVLALAWQVLVALVLPPYAYDALTYHLTTAASWVQSGHLRPTDLSLCCARYPLTAELSFAWPLALAHDDTAVSLVQVPFVLLLAAATAGLARSAGSRRHAAAAAAALVATTPIVLVQAPTGFVDVILAAWTVAGLHWVVRACATGATRPLVLASVAAGLLLGSKGTGVIWGLALVTAAVAVVIVQAWRRTRPASLRRLAVAVVPALLLGSYWYARNWIDTGNPFEPFRIEVAGHVVFDGPLTFGGVATQPSLGAGSPWPVAVVRSWATDARFWHQGSYDYQQRAGGLGPAWTWIGLPLLVPFTVVLARRRNATLAAVAVTAAVFVVQPYRWWARFTIPLAALGAVAIVVTATLLGRRARGVLKVATLGLAAVGVVLATFEVDPASRSASISARHVLALVGKPRADRTVGQLFFPEYRAVEDIPTDATVYVDLEAPQVRFVYPFFGHDLDRRVRPVRGDAVPPRDAWVVTGQDRPVDRALASQSGHVLVADVDGVRVWRPA
jgi:hypothetical protein